MNVRYYYIGVFFDRDKLEKEIGSIPRQPLDRTVSFPHVTFCYKPTAVNTKLFGKPVKVTVTGYGNDGENEGLRVALSSNDPELRSMIRCISLPHITLSLSETAKAVNTGALRFIPVEPLRLVGRFGGYAGENRVDYGEETEG